MRKSDMIRSKLNEVKNNISNAESNINIYIDEITELKNKINEIVDLLKEQSVSDDLTEKLNLVLNTGVSDFSSKETGLKVVKLSSIDDEIIDYSVTSDDLIVKDYITIDGKKIPVYTSLKTDALYIITNDLNYSEKRKVRAELKNYLADDQMAIVTYDGELYKYDINNQNNCTRYYSVVGKTEEGKMYAFISTQDSEIVVDDGSSNDTPITTIKGMVIANRSAFCMEEGANVRVKVRVKENIEGGQRVTQFARLSFSGGEDKSVGSEHATVSLENEWAQYTPRYGISDQNDGRNVVNVGDGPTIQYPKKYQAGNRHVDDTIIDVLVSAHKVGDQHMQGTICYHHEGTRPGYWSKDMISFPQKIYRDWNKII